MKKYFLVTAISAALLLTACGSNQNSTAETSAQTSETTLNSVTEMTVPAFEPEWEETETTSPAPIPEELPQTTTYLASTSMMTEDAVFETTIQITEFTTVTHTEKITTSEETEDAFFEAYVYGVEENAVVVGMKGDTFIGPDGTDVYIFLLSSWFFGIAYIQFLYVMFKQFSKVFLPIYAPTSNV